MKLNGIRSSLCHFCEKAFPVPGFLNFNPVAIDISPLNVRFFRLKKDGKNWIPDIYKNYSLKNPCDVLADEINLEECGDALRALEQIKKEFNVDNAIFSLPEIKTYTFEISVSDEASLDIESAIKFQIEENVPLPPEQVVFDFSIIQPDRISNEIKVAVTALSKNSVASFTKFIQNSNIRPVSFETESSALARAMIPENLHEPVLMIKFGETYTSVAVVEHNIVKYSTTISVSGPEVCLNLKGEGANSLKEELNRLLMYWFTGREGGVAIKKIKKAFLAGSFALCPGVIEFLEKYTKIDVEVGNVWVNCFEDGDYIPDIEKEKSLDLGVVIGLALSSTKYA